MGLAFWCAENSAKRAVRAARLAAAEAFSSFSWCFYVGITQEFTLFGALSKHKWKTNNWERNITRAACKSWPAFRARAFIFGIMGTFEQEETSHNIMI